MLFAYVKGGRISEVEKIEFNFVPYRGATIAPGNIAADLFTQDGRVAVIKGDFLSEEEAAAFKNSQLYCLCIESTEMTDVYRDARLFASELWLEAERTVKNILFSIMQQEIIDIQVFQGHDACSFWHSLNVGRLSYLIGKNLEFSASALENLVIGGILHDMGMQQISPHLLQKTDVLQVEEFESIRQHPLQGCRNLLAQDMPEDILAIVREHHERWNGRGYPCGRKEGQIHPDAQIVGIADVFDALISARPYRPALPPYHALDIIIKQMNKGFSVAAVTALLDVVTLYPADCIVQLNSGEVGSVIAFDKFLPTRPQIIVENRMSDGGGFPAVFDLRSDKSRFIQGIEYKGGG